MSGGVGMFEELFSWFVTGDWHRVSVASFVDCFLVGEKFSHNEPTFPMRDHYNVESMRENVSRIKETLLFYHFSHTEEYRLATQLENLLAEGATPEKPEPIALDKHTAAPYRTLLYDSVQGLLKTPQEQKAFFKRVLYNLTEIDRDWKAGVIRKYGQPLVCAVCSSLTHSVDSVLMRAFCSETCHSEYIIPPLK